LQPPCTHVDQGQQGCAPLCTPYKSTPVVPYSKASVTFSQFACQLFDRFWNANRLDEICVRVCLFLMVGCGKHVKWEKLHRFGMRIF
jgi:hypothetical protein